MRRESKCLPKESSPFSSKSCSFACDGNVLTWESSTNKVNVSHESTLISPTNRSRHIVMLRNIRPMPVQHATSVLINLHLTDTFHASLLKPKVESAYTRE